MGTGTLSQPAGQARLIIGLVAALPAELGCLISDPARYFTPHPVNPHMIGIISGIGADNARRAVDLLLQQGVQALVSWGTAGALNPALKSGDLVVPDTLVAADGQPLHTDTAWARQLRQALSSENITLCGGVMAETMTLLDTSASKTSYGKTTGALAADMETGAIARGAMAGGLPCIAIRAIVDECDDVIPAAILKHMDHYGRPHLLHILGELVRKPGLSGSLLRLARAMNAATLTLKVAARHADRSFSFPAT